MPSRRAEVARLRRLLFDAAWVVVWDSLARFQLARPDREDVTQETLCRVWQQRGRYRSERGSPEAWIRSIARRVAIDFLRKRGRSVPDELPETLAADAPDPEETVKWSQLARFADHVLESLPEEERRAVILREIEGHTFAEIAAIEGISPSTAHARHARGMAAFEKAKEEGKLDAIVVPIARGEGPTRAMLDRAWQRFVDAGGLDLAPESEPPPSGTRRKVRKLHAVGALVAIFVGPGLAGPAGDLPAAAVVMTATATATTSVPTEPAATAVVGMTPATAQRGTSPRGARPPGRVDRDHVTGGAEARDRLRETAAR